MNARVAFIFFAVFACVALAQTEQKLVIDPFTPETPAIIILIAPEDTLPVSSFATTLGDGILGGERNIILTAETGASNLVLTTGVAGNAWSVSTPNSASGFALMQYDGIDGSPDLRMGLNANLIANGGDSLNMRIQSDIDTVYDFTIYNDDGSSATSSLTIPGNDYTSEYVIPFSNFPNVDMSNVGAIEILIEAFDNVDTFVEFFGVVGPVVSPSASPSPNPSASTAPPPAEFTWYTFDDDDNGRSPCGDEEPRKTYFLNDDNIIYYYFYGFGGNIGVDVDGSSSSDASVLAVATSSIFVTLVAMFM